MADIVKINNVLPEQLANDILNMCYANNFPWFYLNDTLYPELSNKNTHTDAYGFFHMVDYDGSTSVWNEEVRKTLKPEHELILSAIPFFKEKFNFEYKKITRIKIGLQTKISNESKTFTPHIDSPKPHVVVIYYVNDSDGDTVFYGAGNRSTEICRVSPEKNSAVFFDGSTHHAGSSPAKHARRIVINFLFEI
jgi:hypothetical protein